MIYIVYGDQPYTIQYNIKRIAKDVVGTIDTMNFVKLDFKEVSYQDIINEATQTPLGYDAKVVVVENSTFLVKESKSTKESKEYKEFISFIKNIDRDITLIFSYYGNDVDKKGEIYNIVNTKGAIKELEPVTDDKWIDYVERYIIKNNITIDRDAISELAKRTSGDVALFRNTIDKLVLYTDHITYKDINLMVQKPLEENVFLIYNNLISKKNDVALKIYRDLIVQNVEPVTIISTLAKQFRLLHEVKYLNKNHKNNKDIATILGIKETRATVIARQVYALDESVIRKALDDLYQLDYQIKSGQVDRFYALELFIIEFNKEII